MDINRADKLTQGWVVLIGIVIGISSVFFKGTLFMLFIMTLVGFSLWVFLPSQDRAYLLTLFILGVCLRIVIYGLFYFLSEEMAARGELVPDSRLYTARAANMARTWLGYPHLPYQVEDMLGRNGYLYILGAYYILIGYIPHFSKVDIGNVVTYSLFSDKLINCLIGTLSGIVIYYIAKEVFNKKVAKVVSAMVIFFPSLILWSMTNTRDPVNILLVALIILSIIKIQLKLRLKYIIMLAGCLLALLTIRQYVFFSMLVIVTGTFFITAFIRSRRKSLYILFVLIVFILLNSSSYGISLRSKFLSPSAITAKLYSLNTGVLSQSGDNYEIYDRSAFDDQKISAQEFIKALLKGSSYFMLAPFPWDLRSMSAIIVYPQIIIWYFILPFSLAGIIIALRYRPILSLSLILYALLISFLFSLVEGNIGSAVHHRDLVLPFYFIFGAAAMVNLTGGLNPHEEE